MASESDIPETGAVFTFGRSRFAGNEPSRFWVRNDCILQLACGDEHTALITESGRVFTFGLNEWGQLGLGDTSPRDKPSCIKDLKKEKAVLVACGRTHTIVTTESGQLYTFGANGEGQLGVKDIDQHITPIQVDSFPPNTKFKMVAAGVDHSVCLTESGKVYVWGGNSEGQLGIGSNDDKPVPTLLSVGEPVISIAAGYYHTALLTEKRSVFVFGEVDSGKLGLGNGIKTCRKPQKLSFGVDRIQAVSCGGSHTVLLTDQKEIYTCGNGENGQLGHVTSKQQISVPEKLNLPFKVTAICCGDNHTALLSDDGYLYTCGDGRYGKLGQGKDNYSNQFQPSRLLRFDPFIVDKVACGGCHMMVLAHHRSIPNEDRPDGVPKLVFDGNQTLLENPLELSGTLSARDRRRQTTDSSFSSLNRTLPSLSGKTLSDHLQNSVSPVVEVRHLPKLKNNFSLGTKANLAEDGDKKEAKSTIHLNEDEQKSGSKNNIQQPVKSLTEIPKPKAAPRTLKPIEAQNGRHAASESSSNDSLEENRLPVLDVGKKIEEKKANDDHIQNIEEIANHKKSVSQTNGFSPRLSNGNAVNGEKKVVVEESPILLSEVKEKEKEKKKKKKKKKEEKGKVKTKDKEKKKGKETPEAKGEMPDSDESEMEELESKENKESEETKAKKTPKKLERKKSKKGKDNERKSKEESEEEEDEEDEEEDSEAEKKDKKNRNSPSKKNSKTKDGKLKGKKEEESSEEEEEEGVNKKQREKKKKKTKDDDADGKEESEGDPIDKLVFAEDLQTESEKQEETTEKKSHTCSIL